MERERERIKYKIKSYVARLFTFSYFFIKSPRRYNGEKAVSSSAVGKTESTYVQEWKQTPTS